MESNAHVLLASFAACALLRLTLALSYLAAPVPGAGKPAVHAAAGVVVVVPARSVKPSRVKQGKTAPVKVPWLLSADTIRTSHHSHHLR